MVKDQVLIVGAGPTGLVLALCLTRLGVAVRIIDKTSAPGTTSRAVAVAAHTLELYRQLDLADEVAQRGHKVPAVNLWVRGRAEAHIPLGAVGEDFSPFPFLFTYPQDAHEQLLVDRLRHLGVEVERQTELRDFTETGGKVVAYLASAKGDEHAEFDYIAGCDGAHSTVRQKVAADFAGGTYRQLFYVADVEASGPPMNGELHVDLDDADFLAIFPLDDAHRARLIGTVRDERADHADNLKFDDFSNRAIDNLKIQVRKVNWFSTYRVYHRVAEHFRHRRAFLLGDAGHVHSPVGGQGMNTGIGDAFNLAWKLAAVLDGYAADTLLDSYEIERRGFAKRLVSTTDRVFTFVTADGRPAELVRTRVAPLLVPRLLGVERIRELLFRTVSQIALNYRDSPVSAGKAGHVHGGERLPWAPVGGIDNTAALSTPEWQVHVYGNVGDDVTAWCGEHGVPLHRFEWQTRYEEAGFSRNALYLIRPDTYVALADPQPSAAAIEHYCAERGLHFKPA